MDIRDTAKKCNRGPGGFKCSCCRHGTLKQAKVMNSRMKRRVSRLACKREIRMDGTEFANAMVNR